ncbi:MAG: hypothetical protein ACR2IP_10330 [Solirubrobacteraceae bacterium]
MRVKLARFAVGAAVLAFPLLATGSAQAAIAGANPESTTNRPDLISATLITPSQIEYCFDKAVTPGFAGITAGNFHVGGYRSANQTASTTQFPFPKADQNNPDCVIAEFTSGGDLNQRTIASVNAGAVQSTASLALNNADSTSLTGSTTNNGTTGRTIGPNLTGVVVDTNSNTITYVEDKAIVGPVFPGLFYFTDSAGNTCRGTGISSSSTQNITIQFKPGVNCAPFSGGPVTDAVRAGQSFGAVQAASDPLRPNAGGPNGANTDDEVTVPGANPQTSKPDLCTAGNSGCSSTGTTLEADGTAVDFAFDQPVANADARDFFAELSTGQEVAGSSAIVEPNNTVRVTFNIPFLGASVPSSQFNEYIVKAAVTSGAVTGQNTPFATNTPGSEPVGDNAGAFARGFTTGPDAFAATLNTTSGVATVFMDQRSVAAAGGGFFVLDQNGNTIGNAGVATFPAQAAGPQPLSVQFTPAQLSVAKNIELLGPPQFGFGSAITFAGQLNVQQILSPTVTSSVLGRVHLKGQLLSGKALAKRRAAALRSSRAQAIALAKKHHPKKHHPKKHHSTKHHK